MSFIMAFNSQFATSEEHPWSTHSWALLCECTRSRWNCMKFHMLHSRAGALWFKRSLCVHSYFRVYMAADVASHCVPLCVFICNMSPCARSYGCTQHACNIWRFVLTCLNVILLHFFQNHYVIM